jgi:SAM-dependent methyltransferase
MQIAGYVNYRKLLEITPIPIRRFVARWRGRPYSPPVGCVQFGELRRKTPISRHFGYDRGLPIDRYYIEDFLGRNAADIRGRVLEIGDNTYTRKFGGRSVTMSDVLHVKEGNPIATFVGDLTTADHLPTAAFDCVILTQTLQLIYDVRAAVATLHRILKPGGVLLATFPGISQNPLGPWTDTWYWGFTRLSAQRLFEERFPPSLIRVETHGNVLASIAFLHGLAVTELSRDELDGHDPDYQMLLTVKAVKEGVR